MTECSYCRYYGSSVPNPTQYHLASHPLNAVAVPIERNHP